MARKRKRPGYCWRILAWDESDPDVGTVEQEYDGTESVRFDELVIDDWFHLEQMDERIWWMCVGDLHINIRIRPDGRREVSGWLDHGSLDVTGGGSFKVTDA